MSIISNLQNTDCSDSERLSESVAYKFDHVPILSESWQDNTTLNNVQEEHDFECQLNSLPREIYCYPQKLTLDSNLDILDYDSSCKWLVVLVSRKENLDVHHIIRVYHVPKLIPHLQISWKCLEDKPLNFQLHVYSDQLFVKIKIPWVKFDESSMWNVGHKWIYCFDLLKRSYSVDPFESLHHRQSTEQTSSGILRYRVKLQGVTNQDGNIILKRSLTRCENNNSRNWTKLSDGLDDSVKLPTNFESLCSFDYKNVHYFVVEKPIDENLSNYQRIFGLYGCSDNVVRFIKDYKTQYPFFNFVYCSSQSILYLVENKLLNSLDCLILVVKLDMSTFQATEHHLRQIWNSPIDLDPIFHPQKSKSWLHIDTSKVIPDFCDNFFVMLNSNDNDVTLLGFDDLDKECLFDLPIPVFQTKKEVANSFVEIFQKFLVCFVNKTIYTCSFDTKTRDNGLNSRGIMTDMNFNFQ